MSLTLKVMGWLNRFTPKTPAPEQRPPTWRAVLAIIVVVPVGIVAGTLVVERVSGPNHAMVGKCVSYWSGGAVVGGFGSARVVDCDRASDPVSPTTIDPMLVDHVAKVIAVVHDRAKCPPEADDSFIANFGGDAGRFCLKRVK